MVSSTTPSDGAKCPPVRATTSTRYSRSSRASCMSSGTVSFLRSAGELTRCISRGGAAASCACFSATLSSLKSTGRLIALEASMRSAHYRVTSGKCQDMSGDGEHPVERLPRPGGHRLGHSDLVDHLILLEVLEDPE